MSAREFDYAVGSAAVNQNIGFYASSVEVNNATNQWLYLTGVGSWVPQYTLGARYSLATDQAAFSFTAPAGQVQPPTIVGQVCVIVYRDVALSPSAGVGMLGGRAPYYDRNPTTKLLAYDQTVGPHVVTGRWNYIVPTGRRAYLEAMQAITEIQTAYTGSGNIDTAIAYTDLIPVAQFILVARIAGGTAIRSRADVALAGTFEMQAGEQIDARTIDPRIGGTSLHYVTAKVTEFDA